MKYNFDEVIDRKGTHAVKVERLPKGADKDSLALWVADMDFACAEPILKALHERIDRKIFGYTMYDADECMDAVTGWMKKRYGWEESRENLFFCPGVVAAYAALINLLTEPGDGIVLQRPIYYPFTNKANSNGRIPVDNALIYENGAYRIDFEDLDKKMADPANKVLVVCSPHNPTGRVWTEDELKKTVEICKKYDKWIICDEIHCDLLRLDQKHIPLGKVMPDYKKLVTCMAPSKTFNLAGLMISNVMIRDEGLKNIWLSKHYNFDNPLSIAAAQAAYEGGDAWLQELRAYLDGNFEFTQEYLKEHLPKATFRISEATYLAWVDLSKYFEPDEVLPLFFAYKAGVLLEGGNMFVQHSDGFIRLNLACPRATLEEGLKRICEAVNTKHTEKYYGEEKLIHKYKKRFFPQWDEPLFV